MSFERFTVFKYANKMIVKLALFCYLLLNVIPGISASSLHGLESLIDKPIDGGNDEYLSESPIALVLAASSDIV